MEMIRRAIEDDVARIVEIARAAYIKYVPRMGRESPPMLADFAAEVAAVVSWCLRSRARSGGLFNLLAQNGNVFHRQHRCRPGAPGFGIGTTANRHNLSAIQLYTNATMTENLAMYAHMGFVETYRVMETQFHIETGFPRVYMCRMLP
jgi:hypothetical protein